MKTVSKKTMAAPLHSTAVRLVRDAWIERRTRNPRYSLRSFARDLSVSASQLSRVLSGQRSLTPTQAARFAAALGLGARDTKSLVEQSILEAPRTAKVPRALRERTQAAIHRRSAGVEMNLLTVERFKAISRWYHLPILELTYLDSFRAEPAWIAARLGISVAEAKDAIERLLELALLEPCAKRGLKKSNNHLFIDSRSQPEVRNFQASMIDKAQAYLARSSQAEMERALINSLTFPVAAAKIPEVRSEILKFQRKLLKLIQGETYEDVYQLNCQLFPLTPAPKKEGQS